MNSSIKILGSRIDCFKGYDELYQCIIETLRSDKSFQKYVTVNNVHTMVEGYWHPSFQAIINDGYLSLPDGKPLEIVGKLKGHKNISRLFGPTLLEKFIDWGRKDRVSHFFFGSSENTLLKLRQAIESKYPGAIIAGMVSPPYAPMETWNHEKFIQNMNQVRPDFIWIGLGAPKQEYWMHDHHEKINSGILFGIGAGFDYMAGHTKHAPAWMKRFALEWLYRLIQEPGRLWKRYLTTIPQFIFFASFELMGIKFKRNSRGPRL